MWQVRKRWFVRYEFTCDACNPTSSRLRMSDDAWRGARDHSVLHWDALDGQRRRAEGIAAVRANLQRLDGKPEAAVSLLSGIPAEKLDEYGGMPKEER